MKHSFIICASFLLWLDLAQGELVTSKFQGSDPQRSVSIRATNGSVVVIGDDRSNVSAVKRRWPKNFREMSFDRPVSSGRGDLSFNNELRMKSSGNRLTISFNAQRRSETLYVWVPMGVDLKVSTAGDGSIAVRNARGEVDVESSQGEILLDKIWGPVVAHALNRDLWVKFAALVAGRPNYLSSLNGDLSLVLPEGADASFDLEFFNGEVETTVPITLIPGKGKWTSENPKLFEPSRLAASNRGGTHFSIKNHNGNITISDYKLEELNEQ